MKEIKLSQGKAALVDDEDFEYLNQWQWYAHNHKHTFYARRHQLKIEGDKKIIYLHRFIMNATDKSEIDHIDHNGLNCQKSNLRFCTRSKNQMNRSLSPNHSSKYKGVTWFKRDNKWRAYIKIGRQIHLGYFDNEIDAAKEYDKKAIELFGEFANINFK